jgi:glycosyltransferase involved in cell wall biosynthesis
MEYPLYDFSMSRILSDSNHVTFCSHSVLSEISSFKSFDHSKTSVIYNGIDFDAIESVKKSETEKTNSISILYAGRLFWVKGVMLLLEAFNRLKVAEDVHLNIFGRGPLKQKVEKFIIDYSLKDRVSFQGHIPHRKMISEIKNSDIVALPSLVEAQPMILLEAMACRKPVVAFDLPFSRELVTNMNNGLLARAGDVNDLAGKLELLVSDGALRHKIGQSAYCQVKKNHNWDSQVEKYLEVYQNVIGNNEKR